jgi:hypothetical protein
VKRWLLIAEASADAVTAKCFADRVLVEQIAWADGNLDSLRAYRGFDPSDAYASWGRLKDEARQCGVRTHGRFGRGQAGGARREIAKAIRIALSYGMDALIAARDTDGTDRREGYEDPDRSFPTCLAIAHPEREAWLICGFDPQSKQENEALEAVQRRLGYDPRFHPDRLNPKRTHDQHGVRIPSSAKNVLDDLTSGDPGRQRRCVADTPLETLRQRGREAGLTQYLEDVATILAPQLGRC